MCVCVCVCVKADRSAACVHLQCEKNKSVEESKPAHPSLKKTEEDREGRRETETERERERY